MYEGIKNFPCDARKLVEFSKMVAGGSDTGSKNVGGLDVGGLGVGGLGLGGVGVGGLGVDGRDNQRLTA